jgi:hypothetical protein
LGSQSSALTFFLEIKEIPENLEDAIADLAVVFHWSLNDMANLTLVDLMAWHERARIRNEVDDDK